jgi:hypothetical protein
MLDATGILTFLEQPPIAADLIDKNEIKRNALLELKYHSPSRVGIAVFNSLPSSASDPKWPEHIVSLRTTDSYGTYESQQISNA